MRYPFSRKTFLIGLCVAILMLLAIGSAVFAYEFFYYQADYITPAGHLYFNVGGYPVVDVMGMWDTPEIPGECTDQYSGGNPMEIDDYILDRWGGPAQLEYMQTGDRDYTLCFRLIATPNERYLFEGFNRTNSIWTYNVLFPLEIKGISPESETEITDLNTNLTIQYKNFDWDIYAGFVVNFRDLKLGVASNSKQFLADNLDPSGTGTEIINLQDFGIDTNGSWALTGLGFGSHLDIEGGMFLTTRGYVDFWTDELVLEPYSLIFNVEGLPSPYTFTNPNDWYSANQERFDTPTAFFTSTTGFMAPLFENISDFALRLQNMFNKKEAYDRGFALGEVFPLINAYIQKIDLFFGGFPLASFFKYLILVMLAIFLIRIIFKFIPFFG